jgi:hypothetical protein
LTAFGLAAATAAEGASLALSSYATGGMWFKSFNAAAANGIGCYFTSYSENDLTTWSSFQFRADKHDGAGALTAHGAAARIFSVLNNTTNLLNIYGSGNIGINCLTFGTNAAKAIGIGSGTAPTTQPADMIQAWSADRGGTAGKASLHLMTEDGTAHVFGDRVGHGTVTPADLFSVGMANGQQLSIGALTELVTMASGQGSNTTTMQIPANAIVLGVSVRVTAVPATTATFTVTGNTSTTAFQTGTNVSTALNTTDAGTKACPYLNTAAQTVKLTYNAAPTDSLGRVRVTIHYIAITPATS